MALSPPSSTQPTFRVTKNSTASGRGGSGDDDTASAASGAERSGDDYRVDADAIFRDEKKKFLKIAWSTALVGGIGLLPFIANFGAKVPAMALRFLGDFFGSFATLSGPIALAINEFKNHNLLIEKADGKENRDEPNGNGKIFDKVRELFYRCCSLGFTPFIFEPFLNPEKLGKSVFHKAATWANIPNLLFTGIAWGFGNFQALLAWILREKESNNLHNAETEREAQIFEARRDGFNRIYNSAKRLATLGSIANPTMQGLRQAADSLALITGQFSPKEFFQRPLLGISRLVSLFVGIPEYFIKGIDSGVRVMDELKHLEPVLPKFINGQIKAAALYFDPLVNTDKNTFVKSLRHKAEILFHTLSPLSMFALFTPLLDEPHTSAEAQARGGATAFLDRNIGRIGKALTILFTGSYVLFARLPQSIMQAAYYGKKYITDKISGHTSTAEEMNDFMKNTVANSWPVNLVSGWSKKCVNWLVKNYYTAEHQHSHLTFEQAIAEESLAGAKEVYKEQLESFKAGSVFPGPRLKETIIDYCIDYAKRDSRKNYHSLTEKEEADIREVLEYKVQELLDPKSVLSSNALKIRPRFPGAYFLATYLFRLFNVKDRMLDTDYTNDYRNMKTVYKREELDYSFEVELMPVYSECVQGLRRTVNLFQGVLSA